MLWALFWCNLLGTIYGYIWYDSQLIYTYKSGLIWQLIFVPDSPTASLFFTLSILFLLYPPKSLLGSSISRFIEALGVVTSVKYGIWAVVIIFAGASKGDELFWQDWMLVISHSAMAVEALLFARFFKFGAIDIIGAAAWTFLNDTVDYTYEVFPNLPRQLENYIGDVQMLTFSLTLFSVFAAWAVLTRTRRL